MINSGTEVLKKLFLSQMSGKEELQEEASSLKQPSSGASGGKDINQ